MFKIYRKTFSNILQYNICNYLGVQNTTNSYVKVSNSLKPEYFITFCHSPKLSVQTSVAQAEEYSERKGLKVKTPKTNKILKYSGWSLSLKSNFMLNPLF